ncbi:MAG: LysR family transcriptional regulator [Eubacterium sp.]|nr:LysR family transcriptional regulator [Eubacterium sp.]
MQTTKLKLQQLAYFLDVAETGSFTRAAEKNYTSQSNISYAVKELERYLEVPLFIRRVNEVVLTKYGEAFCPCVQAAFEKLEQGCETIQQMSDPISGEVKIGFSYIFSLSIIPELFRRIYVKAQKDERTLDLHSIMAHINENVQCVEDMILSGVCDIGVTCVRVRDEIASAPIGEQELVLLLPERHPLAKKKRLSLEEVKEEPFILLNGDTEITGSYYMRMFETVGIAPKLAAEGKDWLSLLVEISSGKCLTIAPKSNLQGYHIASVELEHPMKMRPIHLAWPLNRKLSASANYVRQLILAMPMLGAGVSD